MPFLGKTPLTGEFKTLDSITCDGSASYSLTYNASPHSPGVASRLIVSLNGVIQSPNSSYTTDGSTITFSTTLDSNNTIDFITALGEVGNAVVPVDGSVTTDKLADSSVTTIKLANNAVTTDKLDSSSVTTIKLANSSVTTDKLDSDLNDIVSNSASTGKAIAMAIIFG